jgi:hypothetical protein
MKINFEFQTGHGAYKDALYLNDNHSLSQDEINALKQERLDKWLYYMDNPAPPEPEKETVEVEGVLYEKIEIDGQILLKPVEE